MSYGNQDSRWLVERARKMGLSYEEAQSLTKKWLGGGVNVSRSAYHTDSKMTGGDDPPNSIQIGRGER